MHSGQLTHLTSVGREVVCITSPSGVQSFNLESCRWTNKPPLLSTATSVAVSLNRNLVVQTEDSIQIFSVDVLRSEEVRSDVRPSHIYPLGKKYILCVLQPNRSLTLLESETLRELRPDDGAFPFGELLHGRSLSARPSFFPGLVATFDVLETTRAWLLGDPLPEQIEVVDEDTLQPLYGLSPACTTMVTIYNPNAWTVLVYDTKRGGLLAAVEDDRLGSGEVYDITFDSETRFYLKIDGPEQHVQISYDITPSPSDGFLHTITKGEPMPLSEPRATPPYTLDVNCEWVLDAKFRKICWISPGDVRRGDGGHFWNGLSLIMVGDDGVVRKVSFKEPDC